VPVPTSHAIFESTRGLFGSVPSASAIAVCPVCRGPVNRGFGVCYGCECLFRGGPPVPSSLRSSIVPMTTAINPSPWYSRLLQYKRGRQEYWPTLEALVETFLRTNESHLRELLQGRLDAVGVVPSKKGIDFSKQPLAELLRSSRRFGPVTEHLLSFRPDASLDRWQYDLSVFQAGRGSIADRRIVLIEDTWVTGATCMSAAGSLLDLGARSVVVLPIARCINESFWGESAAEYMEAVAVAYRPTWPR
jgi:hypothetical protein